MSKTRIALLWQRWIAPALVATALVVGVRALEVRTGSQGWALAWLFERVRSDAPRPDPRIVIVGIDDATLADGALPHWGPQTLDRRAHAQVIRELHAGGAAVIGLDLFFDRPADDPFADAELAAAMGESGPVVLTLGAPTDPNRAGTPKQFVDPPADYVGVKGLSFASALIRYRRTTGTTIGVQIDQTDLDEQGQPRMIRAFSHALYQAYEETRGALPAEEVRFLDDTAEDLMAIRWPAGPMERAFQVVSYREIWNGSWRRAHPQGLAGKAVVIGQVFSTAEGDIHRTPVGTTSGVFVHAAALQTLLDRAYPVIWLRTSLAIAAIAFILVTLFAYRCHPAWLALGTVVLVLAVWAISLALLARTPSVWLNPMTTTLVAGAALGTRLFWHGVTARRALGRFVAPELAQELATTGRLAGRREGQREASVLFTDMRDYTELSERLEPDELMRLLNEQFAWMDRVIEAHGGRVDKHVGDALMAVFDGPGESHARGAVAAAAALLHGAQERERRGNDLPCLRFGIGVHSGTLAMGALGGTKVEYGAIGDTVNVAARLESATKGLGVPVLISEATALRLPVDSPLVPLGEVALKGKSEPVSVYTLPESPGRPEGR